MDTGSVINRTPSHSLPQKSQQTYIDTCLLFYFFLSFFLPCTFHKYRGNTYKIVVAVPTNNNCAFSPPALLGCSFVALAAGRESGTVALVARSRVAGCV